MEVDNETQRLPITLADIGLAILIGIGTYVLAKRMPSVLEIVLLNRFKVSAGGRYTVITLMTYVIVAIGILLALNTIGARWSQLQWLVAALGVALDAEAQVGRVTGVVTDQDGNPLEGVVFTVTTEDRQDCRGVSPRRAPGSSRWPRRRCQTGRSRSRSWSHLRPSAG